VEVEKTPSSVPACFKSNGSQIGKTYTTAKPPATRHTIGILSFSGGFFFFFFVFFFLSAVASAALRDAREQATPVNSRLQIPDI
jgi:hypothetical protein